jgi:hypothetical protein
VRDRLRGEYGEAFNRLEDKLFAEITGGHSAEAYADPSRFVAKYFLDPQGRPNREKTEEPLSVAAWNHKEELAEVVKAVPGLAIHATWESVLVGWDTTMERGIENEFARLESRYDKKEDVQSAQATVDLKLFLKKYLSIDIDGNGNGNASTTNARPSAPVTFCRWRLHNKELPKVVFSKASGLHMKELDPFTIIGWDAANVDAEIARLQDNGRRQMEQEEAEARVEREREEAEKKARWKRRCKGHDELATKQQRRPSPLGLEHLPGSYLVQCHSKELGDLNDP